MRKRKVTYRPGEIGKLKVVKDFLPPPEKLVLREAAKQNAPHFCVNRTDPKAQTKREKK